MQEIGGLFNCEERRSLRRVIMRCIYAFSRA
jgi:hypothetical protein